MTDTQKTESVLKLLKEKEKPKKVLEKGIKKIQKIVSDKALNIIEHNLHRPFVVLIMYVNYVLLRYSKDEELLFTMKKMTKKEYKKFMKNRNNSILNYESFKDDTNNNRFVIVIYGGGKSNHKEPQQKRLLKILRNNPKITKYYEPFVGGFGSVYNSLAILVNHGVTTIRLSDINFSLINTYRQIQRNPRQVQRHLASIDIEYRKEFGKFFPETKEEAKEWFTRIHKEFTQLELSKKMTPRRAALFMYLNHNTQGGMLNYNMDRKTNKFSFCYDQNKVKKVPLLINKVEIFHEIFNVADIKFSVKRYETVLREIKNDETCLVLFDPPYVKFETVKSTNKNGVESCSYNYGINDFNHELLLKKIKNSKFKFFYYNNHNPLLEEFASENSFVYEKNDVEYRNGSKGTKSIEIYMYSRVENQNLMKGVNEPVNKVSYRYFDEMVS